MTISRRIVYILLSSLLAGSLVLLLIALLDPHQHITLPLVLGLLLLISAFVLFIQYSFAIRKAAASDRKELEQRFGLLVGHVKDYAIFLIDPEGRVKSWNKGAEQIKGYTAAEIVGQPISVFYTDEDNRLGEPRRNLQRALEQGRYESVGLRKR